MALSLRPNCELCDKDLAPNAQDARICSFECTFCAKCVDQVLLNVCPNCGGNFTCRPIRPAQPHRPGICLATRPASTERIHTPYTKEDITAFANQVRQSRRLEPEPQVKRPDQVALFLELETKVWQALVNGDRHADEALLDPGFLGVYANGMGGRADHVGQLRAGPTVAHFALEQARIKVWSDALVLLSYLARWQRVGAHQGEEAMYVSSVWKLTGDGQWLNVFSQDTLAVGNS